jgi:hypothetical protein
MKSPLVPEATSRMHPKQYVCEQGNKRGSTKYFRHILQVAMSLNFLFSFVADAFSAIVKLF